MYSKKYIEAKLLEHFGERDAFSRDELYHFLKEMEPYLKESTFGWRIYDLKKRHRIKDVGRGIYTVELKQSFKPEADKVIEEIGQLIENNFWLHYYNIWTTAWLNEFAELQVTSFMYVFEVDRTSIEDVFYKAKDTGLFSNIFINPDTDVIRHYISELPTAIVLVPMISRAPTMRIKRIVFPTIEKILVDLFCDQQLYFAFQGRQLATIFEGALSKYVINFSRLLNYAKRRHRDDELKEFFHNNPNVNNQVISIIE